MTVGVYSKKKRVGIKWRRHDENWRRLGQDCHGEVAKKHTSTNMAYRVDWADGSSPP